MNWPSVKSLSLCGCLLAALCCGAAVNAQEQGFAALYRDAEAVNIDVVKAVLDIERSRAAVDEARGGWYPQLSLSAGLSTTEPAPDYGLRRMSTSRNYSVSLTQQLLNIPLLERYRTSEQGVAVAHLQAELARDELLSQLATLYLEYLKNTELMTIAERQLAASRDQLELAERLYEGGLVVVTSVLEASANLDLNRTASLDLERARNEVVRRLAELLRGKGQPADAYFLGLHPTKVDAIDFAGFNVERATRNLRYQLASAQVELQQMALEAERAGHYPTLSASVTSSDDDTPLYDQQEVLSLTLSVPLYSGGQTSARADQQRAELRKAEQVRDYTASQLREQVTLLKQNSAYLLRRFTLLQTALESTEQSYHAVLAGFRSGERTMMDVLDAQNSIYGLQQRLVNDRFELIAGYIELQKLTRNLDLAELGKLFL